MRRSRARRCGVFSLSDARKVPGFFASLKNDTKRKLHKKWSRERTACVGCTLTCRPRCGRPPLPVKITGEVRIKPHARPNSSNRDEVPHLFFLSTGCRGHPCPRKCETHGGVSLTIKFCIHPLLFHRTLRYDS